MNEKRGSRPESRAERPEKDVENKEQAEHATEQIKTLEHATDSADQEIFDNVTGAIKEATEQSSISSRELARSPEVREALRELEEIQDKTSEKTDTVRQRLRDLKAQLKRSAVGAAVLLSVFGAELSSAKAAPEPPKKEPGVGRVLEAPPDAAFESGALPRPSFDLVRERALEKVNNDPDLAAEVGEEGINTIREALERFDANEVNSALAELAGVDPSRTAGETPYEIVFVSDAEFNSWNKWQKGAYAGASGWHSGDKLYVRTSLRTRNDGSLHAADILSTLTHEQIHAAYTKGSEGGNFGRESGITGTIHEGTTEWLNTLILARLGVEGHRQAYGGGTVATAFMLEQILGTEELARLHLEGELDDLEDALTEKLGKDAADSIMSTSIMVSPYYYENSSGNTAAMLTALEIAQRSKIAGIDVSELGEKTADYGLHERLTVSEDGNTVVTTTQSRQKGMYQTMMHDTEIRFTPDSPSIKVCFDTFEPTGTSIEDRLYKHRMNYIKRSSERIQEEYDDSYEETKRTPESDEGFKEYRNKRIHAFTLTIPAPDRIWELQKEHVAAETDEQRRTIEDESTRVLQQAAADATTEIRQRFMKFEIAEAERDR